MNQETPDTTLGLSNVNHLERLYDGWFLDYASYVILDRAVPYFEDGLKPVQRRILHSMFENHDGRYQKVATIVGRTMAYSWVHLSITASSLRITIGKVVRPCYRWQLFAPLIEDQYERFLLPALSW